MLSLYVYTGTARSWEMGGDVGGRVKLEKSAFHSREHRGKTSPCHWGSAWSQSCFSQRRSALSFPFLSFLQGDTSKSPPCESPKRGNVDLDPSQLRCMEQWGFKRMDGCHRWVPHGLLVWHLEPGTEQWNVENSTVMANEPNAAPHWGSWEE